jgi:hypothetical protein
LWVSANDLLAGASVDLFKAAKNLFLDVKLFSARHTLVPTCAELDAAASQATHQVDSKSETCVENMMED